jgi:hypothetical protein
VRDDHERIVGQPQADRVETIRQISPEEHSTSQHVCEKGAQIADETMTSAGQQFDPTKNSFAQNVTTI